MNAHRQHEHARRVSGSIWQTMSQRGIQCARADVDQALQELTGLQLEKIEWAAHVLGKGGDATDAFELLAAFRNVSRAAARTALRAERIVWRADVLLQTATEATGARFNPALATLMRAEAAPADREAAARTLKELCGEISDKDLPVLQEIREVREAPAAAHHLAEPEPAPHEPHHVGGGPAPPAAADRALPPRKVKVYGKTAALTIEQIQVRESTAMTVIIEAAEKLAGEDSYDWRNKIPFQVTLRELPEFFALLMGWIDAATFKFHGQNNNKHLAAEHQAHALYLTVSLGSRKIGVPIVDADRYALSTLVLSTMTLNEPNLQATAVLEIARATMLPPPHLAAPTQGKA
ncbi:MAG: hypothetical protein HYX47_12755 [Burkholderiales bacterium]|nr:hypothetical protein [Burkholderiales bacterium]